MSEFTASPHFLYGGMQCEKISLDAAPATLCLAVWVLFRFVLFLGYVPSASMEPTIPAGSVILGIRIFGELEPGRCGHLPPRRQDPSERIAAGEGDRVYLDDKSGSISVNERCLAPAGS